MRPIFTTACLSLAPSKVARQLKMFLMAALLLSAVGLHAQNNTGNPWLVWYPELGSTGSDAPNSAFSIDASTNKIKNTSSQCASYTIGNDLRGYVYYFGSNLIQIIDPRTKTSLGSFNPATLIQSGGTGWSPHSIQGFYISATNKHYIAVTAAGSTGGTTNIDMTECALAIFDVTNPASVTLTKRYVTPTTSVVFNTGSGNAARVPGMVLYQTEYTSVGTKIFMVSDDGAKAGTTNLLGISRRPSVWMDVLDPLGPSTTTVNILPANVHEVAYDLTAANALYDANQDGFGGAHQIAYSPTNDLLFMSSEGARSTVNMNKILSFHATSYLPTYVKYSVGTSTPGSPTGAPSNCGFHGIQVNRAGTSLYTGRAQSFGTPVQLRADEDKAIRFNISAADGTAGSIITVNEAAASASLSTTGGYTRYGVKTTNITPDEAYVYSATEGRGDGTGANRASIWSVNPTTMAIVSQVQKAASSAGATFNFIDPHSYAFTLSDFGDAPLSYGTPFTTL
jgi:hypothetical protein